jgi:cysteine desulfurase/selenocysteine lyase
MIHPVKIDVDKIRADFPILKQQIHGHPLAYLDNAATTQRPESVITAVDRFYRECNSNVHRGVYTISEQATELFEGARAAAARFLNAAEPAEIVFVRNATEGVNLLAHAWARKFLKSGDTILLTEMEHHANLIPWQMLAKERGVGLKFIPITADGRLDLASIDSLMTPDVKLLSVTHMSNVLGTINPVKDIVARAKERGIVTIVDGAQAAPHIPVDVLSIDCDFYVATGHKMLGPTGSGFVYGKRSRWEEADPFQGGGHMINEVTYTTATWNEIPYKFEAGTPDIAAVVGLTPALEYLNALGLANIEAYEKELAAYALEGLRSIEGMILYGPTTVEDRAGIISFNLNDIHSHDVATVCDANGIAVRSGHHCAQPLVNKLGTVATSRVSFYVYNTKNEIDRLISALEQAKKMLS